MKKKKDPIKELESLRDWNRDMVITLSKPLKHDWPEFYKLARVIGGLFELNQNSLDGIIKEMKKLKKKK